MTQSSLLIALSAALSAVLTGLIARRIISPAGLQEAAARSMHVDATPTGAGTALVIPYIVWSLYLGQPAGSLFALTFAAILLVSVTGFLDDRLELDALPKFLVQVAAICMIIGPAIAQDSFFPLDDWPLKVLAALVMGVCGVWWLNVYNFMDGIDGLAATQALFIAAGALGAAGLGAPMSAPMIVALMCFAASLGAFLWFNWPPARVFMGDTGSLFIATLLFAFAVTSSLQGSLPVVFWLILAAPFIADTTFTLLCRLWRRERISQAHRSHAYQRWTLRWKSHTKTVLLVLAYDVAWLLPLSLAVIVRPSAWQLLLVAAYLPLLALLTITQAGLWSDI